MICCSTCLLHSLVDSCLHPDEGSLVYQDDALTNRATRPGLQEHLFSVELNELYMYSDAGFYMSCYEEPLSTLCSLLPALGWQPQEGRLSCSSLFLVHSRVLGKIPVQV